MTSWPRLFEVRWRNRGANQCAGAHSVRTADALLSIEGSVSSFEHVSRREWNVRTRSIETRVDKARVTAVTRVPSPRHNFYLDHEDTKARRSTKKI
jgi:hypothetical protein